MGWTTARVLHALSGDEQHGLDVVRTTGLPSGVVYAALVRLDRAGLVETRTTPEGRRHYLLTPDGVTALPPARTNLAHWTSAAVIALVTSYFALRRPPAVQLSDLHVYVGAARELRDGLGLYDFMSANHAPFTYPPVAGLIFSPLTWSATFPLQIGWTAATVATVVVLAVLLGGRRRAPAVAVVLLLSAPVTSDIRFGQVSIFLAALVVIDVLVLRHSRWQGALIGIAAAIKLTPLIFIPMLWFAGRRRAATVAATTFAACGVVAWAVLPADSWRFWGTEMWRVDRLGHITSTGNQSLNAAVLRLGVEGTTRSLIVLAIAGAITVIAFGRARTADPLTALVLVGTAGVILSPVSWTHHQVWLVMAALLPVRGPAWARHAWMIVVPVVMLLPVTSLGGPVWSNARLLLAVAVVCAVPLRRPVTSHSPAVAATSKMCWPGHHMPGRTGARSSADRATDF